MDLGQNPVEGEGMASQIALKIVSNKQCESVQRLLNIKDVSNANIFMICLLCLLAGLQLFVDEMKR